jgi:DNA excision repair protein ERCC-4
MPKSSKKRIPKSSKKQNRSSLPLSPQKQTRSSNQSGHTQTNVNGNGANKPQSQRSGGTEVSGFEQNSQNDNVNEKDKVVSDGSFIYAAYGDVLQVWSADGSTDEISITQMPGEGKDCDRNPLEPCTSKPVIGALFLGNGRLTVVVTQYMYGYGATDQTQPIIMDYGDKLAVVVYDISTVTLGLPLNELAYKELTGRFLDGGSIGDGDKAVIATFNYVDTWFTEDVSRSQSQYCGLNTTAYIELAKSTAESQIASLAKQMATELELVYNCSGIVQVSTMQDGSIDNARNLTGSDFLLGSFVQLFTLNVSSANGDIPATVSGLFTPSYGSDLYLTEDFIALPLNIYDDSIFILGFGLSADGAFKPFSYGHIPGEISNLYRMDKKDGYLRFAFGYIINDEVTWATTYHSKIYVLELPSTPGAMTLVGESNLFGEDGHFVQSSRFSGDLAFLSGDDYENESQFVVVVDLSNPSSPKALGSLQVRAHTSYLNRLF